MQELSLNILDIAENSVKAGASLITVAVCYRPAADRLTVTITDDGCGMDAETVRKVTDPFYTSRTTRRVGMGLPLWKMAAEMTGGTGDGGLWDEPHRPAAAGGPAPDDGHSHRGQPGKGLPAGV